jgi:hypothetical protein
MSEFCPARFIAGKRLAKAGKWIAAIFPTRRAG